MGKTPLLPYFRLGLTIGSSHCLPWSQQPQTLAPPRARAVGEVLSGPVSSTGRSGSVALPKAQPRLGLEVERRLGSNVGIAAGTYLNLVHYRIQGDLYEAKPDFFPQGIQPAEVKAACPMIEIPISVKYYFSGSRANSFYASAGAVSYFILKEDYKYKYTEQSAALKKEWTERSGDRHLFGVGLASFGYQRHLPRSGFLALETYVHLPFTAMGHGNVMLRSAGLSLKYQFDFSSRR